MDEHSPSEFYYPEDLETCIYAMVSAMTSYSSLTSVRIFVSRQHSTESDFEFPP